MSQIADVHGRQILDSRGNPTVEVEVQLSSGCIARASVPSGSSTGSGEAVELRDNDAHFRGKGVRTAVRQINGEVALALNGRRARSQAAIDEILIDLDGTEEKSRLGANAMLAVSLACARVSAYELGIPLWQYLRVEDVTAVLPMPMLNVLNGGVHADNGIDFQEYMIVPTGAATFLRRWR